MESLAPLVAVGALWGVSAFAPGWVLVRGLGWSAGERLCAAIGISLFIVYLWTFGALAMGLGAWANWVLAGLCVAAGVVAVADIGRGAWRLPGFRRLVWIVLGALAWGTVFQAVPRHYAGGLWTVDWVLHWDKAMLWMDGGNADPERIRYLLIDRPALMNMVSIHFLQVFGRRFDVMQLVFTWMDMLLVLPCVMLAGTFMRRGQRRVWVVLAALVCLPTLWANATYTWTKLLAGFYVLAGVHLYLRGVSKGDRTRVVVAFGMMAAGILAHYIAMPFVLSAAVHYVVFVWRGRRGRWAELAAIVVVSGAILGTWFGWVALRYGVEEMMGANNTIKNSEREAGQVLMKMARNFVWTIFPHPMRMSSGVWNQAHPLGRLRDYLFLIYQTNIIFIPGLVAGPVALVLAFRRLVPAGRWGYGEWLSAGVATVALLVAGHAPGTRDVLYDLFPRWPMFAVAAIGLAVSAGVGWSLVVRRAGGRDPVVWFWRTFVVVTPIAAAVAVDVPCPNGIAHLFFHSWAMLAVALVVMHACDWPRWARAIVAGGAAVDFVLGVWLHLYLQRLAFRIAEDGTVEVGGMATMSAINYMEKVSRSLVFLGDRITAVQPVLLALIAAGGVVAVAWVAMGCPRRGRGMASSVGGE